MRLRGAPPSGYPALSYINKPEGSMIGSAELPIGHLIAIPGHKGDTGPANELAVGVVVSGPAPVVEITGAAPHQELNLTLPKGDKGDTGDKGDKGDQGDPGPTDFNLITNRPATYPPTIGTTSDTAKAGDYRPAAADITDATTVGRNVLKAADAAAARTAIGAEDASQKGAANGYCPLGSDAKIASTYLPSYVDDVVEYANLASFPGTGETGKMYVALDTNRTYRWGGSSYVEISASPGSTDAVPEGSINKYYTDARADARVAAGITGKADKITTVSAGTGLTGGGDLSDNRTLSVAYGTSAGTACQGNDSRLSDTRTPTDNTVSTVKLQDGAVTSAKIADGTIVDADISASAGIAVSKLGTGKVTGSVNGTGTTLTLWTGTAAQYAAIGTKDSNTIYVVTP